MYEEPYRWVEAVSNRRQYLDEQLRHGSPIVAISFHEGIVLATFNQKTPKLYEVYDRLALGGIGHPADLETLRGQILDMAHLEGFQRSPSDVTGSRLMKYGLAPTLKQAYEEIFKAPFITKLLLADLGLRPEHDTFLTCDYDGTFEESTGFGVLASSADAHEHITAYLKAHGKYPRPSLDEAFETALYAWGMASWQQQQDHDSVKDPHPPSDDPTVPLTPDKNQILQHLRDIQTNKDLECVVLDRQTSTPSTYRTISQTEGTQRLASMLDHRP